MNEPAAGMGGQPRIRHNDYSVLQVPETGRWAPHRSLSVVIPAYRDQEKLDLTLASLAAQSYPAHLLEVVVVDDGSTPPLRLPEIVPERTRLVRGGEGGWGRAHACHTGAAVADGEIVHWLDCDMVLYREHVEAQARWHHLADYLVVLGYKRFVDFSGGETSPAAVFEAVRTGAAGGLFDVERSHPHEWVEKIIDESDGLRAFSPRTYRVHVGATASVPAELLRRAGGMDDTLVLGEDTDLGFRLAQQGAVFVPEPEARSWHLGPSTVMRRREEVARHNEPYMSQLLPLRRDWRRSAGRQWLVPYVDVVVDATDASSEAVRGSVAGVLAGPVHDIRVTVVGPWSKLGDERRSPLDDPLLDLRLTRAAFAHDGRVDYVESPPATSAPAPYRLTVPAGWRPTAEALTRLVELADSEGYGVVLAAVPDDDGLKVARFERTAAIARAEALRDDSEDLDQVVHELFGTFWLDGTEWALAPATDVVKPASAVELEKWTREAKRWKKKARQQEQEIEQWQREAARLKRKVQAPLSEKLMDGARQRAARIAGTSIVRRSPRDRD
ncbi:glycosyltransferase [Spirillospora sp. NPDC047279]|uniref:glycosyltransferase n=1 Tax=Spirillospora sp. NPDC047279 TaxID=3155478 RepID=UPI0033EAC9F1